MLYNCEKNEITFSVSVQLIEKCEQAGIIAVITVGLLLVKQRMGMKVTKVINNNIIKSYDAKNQKPLFIVKNGLDVVDEMEEDGVELIEVLCVVLAGDCLK